MTGNTELAEFADTDADLAFAAKALLPDLIRLRRSLHAEPELGLHLPATQRAVLDALSGLDLEIARGRATTSVVAVLHGGRPGPVVLLRGDMDALPMKEQTDLAYTATGDAMHACGHDLHVAGLVGAAHLLHGRREQLAGSVIFMFQPGEELGSGAEVMLEEGVLTAAGVLPVAAYGIHVVPGERGIFSTRAGALMAGAVEIRATVHGRGGHASAPHLAVDPVPVVAEIVTAMSAFVTRRFDVFDPIVLSVTQLSAGGPAINVIPDSASFGATCRVLSHAALDRVRDELPTLIEDLAAAAGCRAEVALDVLCPATVNDAALANDAIDVLSRVFGAGRVRQSPAPVMGSEDFSFVLEQVPGVFLFLRATPDGVDPDAEPNHSPRVVFDDSVLADQAVALASLALVHLS